METEKSLYMIEGIPKLDFTVNEYTDNAQAFHCGEIKKLKKPWIEQAYSEEHAVRIFALEKLDFALKYAFGLDLLESDKKYDKKGYDIALDMIYGIFHNSKYKPKVLRKGECTKEKIPVQMSLFG